MDIIPKQKHTDIHKTKQASAKRVRPMKDYADVQCSIQLGSPEALAKKIMSTPHAKGRSKTVKNQKFYVFQTFPNPMGIHVYNSLFTQINESPILC